MWSHDGWGSWWFMMPPLMLAFWGAVIWVVVNLFRDRPGPAPPASEHPAGPEEVLAQRYARGEIDDNDYQRRLDILRGSRRPGGEP
jgi:putative membrane protein